MNEIKKLNRIYMLKLMLTGLIMIVGFILVIYNKRIGLIIIIIGFGLNQYIFHNQLGLAKRDV